MMQEEDERPTIRSAFFIALIEKSGGTTCIHKCTNI